jgi:hypothetical protein
MIASFSLSIMNEIKERLVDHKEGPRFITLEPGYALFKQLHGPDWIGGLFSTLAPN